VVSKKITKEVAQRRGLVAFSARTDLSFQPGTFTRVVNYTELAKVLDWLGHPTFYTEADDRRANPDAGTWWTTVSGRDDAEMIMVASGVKAESYIASAERFKRRPELLHEFRAVHALGGEFEALKAVLLGLS
jgi:hypothetical protein